MISCKFEDGDGANLRHAVIDAIIIKNSQLLLVKRSKKLTQGGKWGLVGGFVERDETVKQTAYREVFEESGYRLKSAEFFTIIDTPNRRNEDRQNIAFVYVCKAGQKEGKPDWESTQQRWFDLDNLPKPMFVSDVNFFELNTVCLCGSGIYHRKMK